MNTPDTQLEPGALALADALRLSFRALRGLMSLLALAYLASGIFVVQQHERALVLRFGKIAGMGSDRIKEPGLHWTWPRPFSEIVRVSTERVLTMESRSFWYGRDSDFQDNAGPGATLRPDFDGYVVTGDANLLHCRWALRFTVADPLAYAFNFIDPDAALHGELDRAIMHVSARFAVDKALRTDLESYRDEVERVLRSRLDALRLGVRVQGVDVLAIAPPRQVASAFDAVTQSAQERAQRISDARAYAVRAVNEAQGDASRVRAEGESARQSRVSETSARADAFASLYPKWKANPEVTAQILLQDGILRALAQVDAKYVVHGRSEGQEIRLHLGPEQKFMAEGLR